MTEDLNGGDVVHQMGNQGAVWSLTSNGDLAFAAAGTPVVTPLPPALWLLGSAMAGLVGVARRRKASV